MKKFLPSFNGILDPIHSERHASWSLLVGFYKDSIWRLHVMESIWCLQMYSCRLLREPLSFVSLGHIYTIAKNIIIKWAVHELYITKIHGRFWCSTWIFHLIVWSCCKCPLFHINPDRRWTPARRSRMPPAGRASCSKWYSTGFCCWNPAWQVWSEEIWSSST
jgi:hypothetical protein